MKRYNYYITIMILLLSSCSGKDKVEGNIKVEQDSSLIEVTQEQFVAMKMEIAELQEREFDTTVKAAGKIDVPPKDRVKVTSFVGGYVKSTSLLVGSKVTKGQALLVLESPEYIDLQQSYMEIAGQIDFLYSEYVRQKTLFDEKISSQKKYLEAESNYKRAKAVYESLRQKLNVLHINPSQVEKGTFSSQITIYSPISGDVTAINVNVGMAVSPSDVIMEIVNTEALHLELAVFEKDVFSLHNGQKLRFTIPQVGDDEFEAVVSQIGKSVEGSDRIVNIYASLAPNIRQKMLTGMFVEAQLIASSRKALSVPFDAITSEEGKQYILALESEKDKQYIFKKQLIKTGERNGDWIEIIADDTILSNQKILFKGVYDIL